MVTIYLTYSLFPIIGTGCMFSPFDLEFNFGYLCGLSDPASSLVNNLGLVDLTYTITGNTAPVHIAVIDIERLIPFLESS